MSMVLILLVISLFFIVLDIVLDQLFPTHGKDIVLARDSLLVVALALWLFL